MFTPQALFLLLGHLMTPLSAEHVDSLLMPAHWKDAFYSTQLLHWQSIARDLRLDFDSLLSLQLNWEADADDKQTQAQKHALLQFYDVLLNSTDENVAERSVFAANHVDKLIRSVHAIVRQQQTTADSAASDSVSLPAVACAHTPYQWQPFEHLSWNIAIGEFVLAPHSCRALLGENGEMMTINIDEQGNSRFRFT